MKNRRASRRREQIRAGGKPRRTAEKGRADIRPAERTVAEEADNFTASERRRDGNAAQRMAVGGDEIECFCRKRLVEKLSHPRLVFFQHHDIYRLAEPAKQMAADFPTADVRTEQDDAFAAIQKILEQEFALVRAFDFCPPHDDGEAIQQRDAEGKKVAIDQQRPFPKRLRAEDAAEKIFGAAVAGRIGRA